MREILIVLGPRYAHIPLSEQLSNITALYPKIDDLLQKSIRDAKLANIKARDFRSNKDRLILIYFLLKQRKDLDLTKRRELIQFILVQNDLQAVRDIIGSSKQDVQSNKSKAQAVWSAIKGMFTDGDLPLPKPVQEALSIASETSDPEFLLRLQDELVDDETLNSAVIDTKNMAQRHFEAAIPKLLKKVVHGALHIQQEDCVKQIQREASSQLEKDIEYFRRDFIRAIEERSESESKS